MDHQVNISSENVPPTVEKKYAVRTTIFDVFYHNYSENILNALLQFHYHREMGTV